MDQEETDHHDSELLAPEPHQEVGEQANAPALADEVLPDTLVLLPLPGRPFFPGQVQPVSFNPDSWQATLDAIAQQGSGLLGLAFVDAVDPGEVTTDQFPDTGCVVRLHRPPGMRDHAGQFLAQGLRRFRIVRWLNESGPLIAQVEYPRSQGDRESDEIKDGSDAGELRQKVAGQGIVAGPGSKSFLEVVIR